MSHHTKNHLGQLTRRLTNCVISLLTGLIALFSHNSYANDANISTFFEKNVGCFILYDLTNKQFVEHYNPKLCAKRISAHSTFKVPLSIMAFDQHIISQQSTFKWDGQQKEFAKWNHNQTPKSWLQYSVVWVSQRLTPQLGMNKIVDYLTTFHYGNCDFTGNPGKNDGLQQAWLSSSLKISADEQLKFLIGLFTEHLPVSKSAMQSTKDNMFIQKTAHASKLYGKTGSGHGSALSQGEGWFVGLIQNSAQQYIVVTNVFYDSNTTKKYGGYIAKDITIRILNHMHLM